MEIKKVIKLTPNQVKDFVSAATKCDFDVDVSYNHFTVDAKSILGVFGLNFDCPLTVRYRGFNKEFENYLSEHAVAC
ncbi:PTS HPr component phosphorylation site [Butyrivibrio sp. ob235]|uniref:HPr family phosphocarrier protein n=1 Tax=Butyrivibrio sp. ob235 TaxID=1761780 RepID=UPI0008C4B559|nr:HPr family phosphocarrier protein [Butyrivibrio sp. ob235]SEK69742.1 PTS HPr component phosphorylation site [Butyrivibrio sp. ob235]